MRPQPLQPHNARDMAASGEKEESLVDFLKDSEALAILHEQQISVAAAQKAAAEINERLRQSDTPLLSSLRRKLSSTFVKDAPEQPKLVDQDSPSPSHPKGAFFRKASNTKPSVRGDSLTSISENDTVSATASDMGNRFSRGREEQPALGKTNDSSNSTKQPTSPAPAPKAATHKPLLVVDTAQAVQKMTAPANDSTALKSLSGKDKKSPKQSSPSVINSKQSSPSVVAPSISSKFSSLFTKPKTPKYKDNDPEVKAIERLILQDEYGVNKTSELTSAYPKGVPTPAVMATPTDTAPSRRRMLSHAESATASYFNRLRNQSQPDGNFTPTMPPIPDPVHQRETSDNSMESTGSVIRSAAGPHNSLGSALSATDMFDSQTTSTLPSSALRTSGGTGHSVTVPNTPETSNVGGLHRFQPKEVGSGHSHEGSSILSASPTSYLAGVAGHPRTGQHSSSIVQSPVKQGIGRSFTDPYDGQASIGSIVRATRAAFLDYYDQSVADSPTYPFKQHTMSSREGSSADSNANLLPRPIHGTGGGSLEGLSGKTNTSSGTGSYEYDVLQSRGHGSNEYIMDQNALSGAMLPISHTGDRTEQRNQPRSGLYEQDANSNYASSVQANNQTSNAVSGNISGSSDHTAVGTLPARFVSGSGSSRGNSVDVRGTTPTVLSPSHPSPTTVIRDFQNLQIAVVPSNRYQLEVDAEEDRRRRRMTKERYALYRVSPAARRYPTREANLFMKEDIVRKKTKTNLRTWDGHDDYPRHPNHGFRFLTANLWCNECTDRCARCNRACCAFKDATLTLMSETSTRKQKADAMSLQKEIQTWLVTGKDNKTFMDCTECKQFACPRCISICPVEPCCDRLCIGCNRENFWKPCEYHTRKEICDAFANHRMRMTTNWFSYEDDVDDDDVDD